MKRTFYALVAALCAAMIGTAQQAWADPGNTASNSTGTIQVGGVSADPNASVSAGAVNRTIWTPTQPSRLVSGQHAYATPGTYTMDHSAGTFVFDPQGRLRLYVSYGQGPDVFVHDIRELLRSQS